MLSTHSKLRLSIALFALISTTFAMAEGDATRGEVLADTCKGCHAVESYTNVYPTYHVPRVAGQSAGYIAAALKLYQDGDRAHTTMIAQASAFSDQDMQDIAVYLAASGPQLDPTAAANG